MLSQRDDEGVLHPCAFYSRKFTAAELNYEIYDKELLCIVDALRERRHHLEGSGHEVQVYSDHKNLLWFTETKRCNRRQARWAEELSRFDFVITYRPGRRQGKPDALSRRPDYGSHKRGDRGKAREEIQILKLSQFSGTDEREGGEFSESNDVEDHQAGGANILNQVHTQTSNRHVALTLNWTNAQVAYTDDDLAQAIKSALPNGQDIGPYLSRRGVWSDYGLRRRGDQG